VISGDFELPVARPLDVNLGLGDVLGKESCDKVLQHFCNTSLLLGTWKLGELDKPSDFNIIGKLQV
jgi:hypothetical protein